MTQTPATPHVVQFLRSGGTIEDLQQRFALSAARSTRAPDLVLLKYDQLDSPMAEPIVRECRGLILDTARDFCVVSRSFDKFFNFGEGHGRPVDWKTARVMEKLDGSLMVMFHHDGDWRVQSSGLPDANGTIGADRVTLESLFWSTFRTLGYSLPKSGNEDHCFAFELTSVHNEVVVRQRDAGLHLIGVRNRETQVELNLVDCAAYGYAIVRSFPLGNIAEIKNSFLTMNPLAQEGYVVVDQAFNRAKVKHPGYVAIHHMRSEFTVRRLVDVVRSGEIAELAAYFPEWGLDIARVHGLYEGLLAETTADFERLRHHTVQKDFAAEATKCQLPAALFGLRAGKITSLRRYAADMNIDSLMKALRLTDATS
jgi:RNA ligase